MIGDDQNARVRSEQRSFGSELRGQVRQVLRIFRWSAPDPDGSQAHQAHSSADVHKPRPFREVRMDLTPEAWGLWDWNFAFSGQAPQFFRHPVGSHEHSNQGFPYGPRRRSIARRYPTTPVREE
jgi:hypothetical protein